MAGLDASVGLARFASAAQWGDVPPSVRHEACRALINFFAVALAGCRDPALDAAAAVFDGFRSGTECTVIGRAERTDALHAASLNAMSGNVFDFDDTHLPTIIHPTAPVAPALFALAQVGPVSGADLLLAFAVGVEVECRVGNAVSPGHYARGWHITSTCGVFGAAAACARLLRLDETRTLWALGHAAAQAGGLVENLGTMAKSIGVGNAASNGLLSALLAQRGFEGPRQPLEGPRGFLKVTSDAPDFSSLTEGLGQRWELMNNTYKPYPCGVVLNPVIEACLDLHGELASAGIAVEEIERVELTGHPLLRQRTDRALPYSGREAQVSAQHAIAVTLATGRAGLDEFSDGCVAQRHWRAFAERIVFVDDARYSIESVTVALSTRGGHRLSRHVDAAHGSLASPLTDGELEAKLRTLAAWSGTGCEPAPLIDAIWSLPTLADAGRVMRLAEFNPIRNLEGESS